MRGEGNVTILKFSSFFFLSLFYVFWDWASELSLYVFGGKCKCKCNVASILNIPIENTKIVQIMNLFISIIGMKYNIIKLNKNKSFQSGRFY